MKVKPLSVTFTKSPNGLPSVFTQVDRNEYAAIYRRTDPKTGEFQTHEVFAIRVGQPSEFLNRKQAEEMCPGASAFGFWAWDCKNAGFARKVFDEITKGNGLRGRASSPVAIKVKIRKEEKPAKSAPSVRVKGKRNRIKVDRPVVKWPQKPFTMKDLAKANSQGWTQPTLYLEVNRLLGTKVEVAERKQMGRGRPTVFYRAK